MTEPCPTELLELAQRAADLARPVLRRHYRSGVAVRDKADRSPVTAADREVEELVRNLVVAECPEHGVIGEELGFHRPQAEYVWVLDPIDGTQAFVCGIPLFTTLIALTHKGEPLLGVIDQPVIGERWVGAQGRPTTLNGQSVSTRDCSTIAEARLCATSPDMFKGQEATRFARITEKSKLVRYGTDGYAYALLASGCIDLVVEADLAPYDYLAHVPVVQGAGGVITDWEGRSLDLSLGATRLVASANPVLHARVLEALGGEDASPQE